MKKSRVVLITVVLLLSTVLYGCGNETGSGQGIDNSNSENVNSIGSENQDGAGATIKVTFYDTDGTTVLSEEEIPNGSTATEYVPKKEGQVFMGWFATPSLAHNFDFSQALTQDTQIFAGFMEEIDDTRTFAIVGSGTSPLLSASSWGKVINEEHYLTKSEGENVYTITLDLCEGDEFQFAIDSAWSDQRGGGYMTATEADGVTYFQISGGLSDNSQKSNIKCAVTGNYTFILTTYPGADVYDTGNSYYTEETKENYNSNPYDTIEFIYNGDMVAELGEMNVTYYIKGAIVTGWQDLYEEQYAFTEENGIHTLTITLEEGDEFLLTTLVESNGNSSVGNEYVRYTNISDEASLAVVDGTESANIIAKQAGTYTFTYDPATSSLTVEFAE